MTASRALSAPSKVKPETRDRVLRAMRTLNYVPNRVAGGLSTRTSRLLPVVVPSLTNAVFIDVIRGAQEVLEAAGYQILLGSLEYDVEKESEAVAALLSWSPDAFILSGTEHSQATHDLLRSVAIPIVEIMDLTSTPIDVNIGFSHEKAGHDMGAYLIGRGYRSMVFAGVELDRDRRAMKRYAGFRSALVEAGLAEPPVVHLTGGFGPRSGADGMHRLLDEFPQLDCAYFANDDLAVGALITCQERVVRVPEQVAIAGFNGLEIGQTIRPKITTTLSPRWKVGHLAADYALRRIRGEIPQTSIIDVGCEIIPGESA
jgi:LacI family gluconate utilization system Gnt-I transcriptional repressor